MSSATLRWKRSEALRPGRADIFHPGAPSTHLPDFGWLSYSSTMTMNGDIEETAAAAYRSAGFGMNQQAPAVLLAQRLMGKKAVRELPQAVMIGTGALVRVGTEWRIYVRRESDATIKRFRDVMIER